MRQAHAARRGALPEDDTADLLQEERSQKMANTSRQNSKRPHRCSPAWHRKARARALMPASARLAVCALGVYLLCHVSGDSAFLLSEPQDFDEVRGRDAHTPHG